MTLHNNQFVTKNFLKSIVTIIIAITTTENHSISMTFFNICLLDNFSLSSKKKKNLPHIRNKIIIHLYIFTHKYIQTYIYINTKIYINSNIILIQHKPSYTFISSYMNTLEFIFMTMEHDLFKIDLQH